MKKAALTSVVMVLGLTGCTMIPDYTRPDYSEAAAWQEVPGYAIENGETAAQDMAWQSFFRSEALRQVVGTALEHNRDLRQAALNVAAARAALRIERADLLPSVNGGVGANYQTTSDESSPTGDSTSTELYSANLGVSAYELDLFGRVRSQNRAALNEYLATEAGQQAVRISLIAETANTYLQYLADLKLLDLTHKTLKAQLSTYDLLSKSQEEGISTRQDVARAETAVETARVNQHLYLRLVEQDKNALYLLLGVAQDQYELPVATLDDAALSDDLAVGMPSDVLLARPDIRQAEYALMARNADIGAARAAFFPSISLTGSYGFASQDLGDLISDGALGAWSFVPQLTVPIFNSGRNKANLELAEIRKEQAILSYEQAIEGAFREVADELAARATLTKQLEAQQRLVAAAQRVYDLSNARYKSGIDSFLGVLDAQRELYIYQQNEIQIERQQLANMIDLYKALGGGWQREANPL